MFIILSNIFFGHPKLFKFQVDYFEKWFLPFVDENKPESIIIIGNIFYHTSTVSFNVLSKLKSIFSQIDCKILIVNNEYCFHVIKDFADIESTKLGYEKKFSLFQTSKENPDDIGFFVEKDNVMKFIHNDFSPRFIEYEINSIDDLDKIELTNDFIDIIINGDLIDSKENKNKIDIFLNNNTFNNVFYTDNKKDPITISIRDNKIRNILLDNIEEGVKKELNEIFVIYDEKK